MEIIQMGLTKYMTPANLGQEIRNRKRQRDSKHERLGMSLLALKMKGGSVAMQVVSRNWEQISLTVSKDQGTSVLSLKELYLPQPRKLGRGPRATDWLQPDQNLDFSFQDARQRTQSCHTWASGLHTCEQTSESWVKLLYLWHYSHVRPFQFVPYISFTF